MINELIYLKAWCENYKEKTSIKLHPNNVPVDVILNELMGELSAVKSYCTNLHNIYDKTNERIAVLDKIMDEIIKKIRAPMQEETKITKKNSKSKIDKKEADKWAMMLIEWDLILR